MNTMHVDSDELELLAGFADRAGSEELYDFLKSHVRRTIDPRCLLRSRVPIPAHLHMQLLNLLDDSIAESTSATESTSISHLRWLRALRRRVDFNRRG